MIQKFISDKVGEMSHNNAVLEPILDDHLCIEQVNYSLSNENWTMQSRCLPYWVSDDHPITPCHPANMKQIISQFHGWNIANLILFQRQYGSNCKACVHIMFK